MSDRDLSRMGAASVVLSGQQVIEKHPVSAVERAFYQHVAPELKLAGINTPALIFLDVPLRKLRLEFIPHPLEQADVASDEALAMLGRLHRYPPHPQWLYHPHSWPALALEKSLSLLQLPEISARQLRFFQQHSDSLFSYPGLISGDSNAGNWGRRESGELVLFDWERFGTGSQAIDLAPLIKGMGTQPMFVDLAERYCRLTGHSDPGALAREIALAKAWIVTEVIVLLDAREKAAFSLYQGWYKEHLPGWLDAVVGMI
ncbi:phosphotransferase [Enterobacter soli]|uniref:phosphotransferase n=1 Tax=Enterobacter soli TaxID=885040 RepID=UPI0034CF11BF